MKNQLFKLAAIIVFTFSLAGCRTALEHIEIAKKKDPNIILCKDSIKEIITPGESITVFAKDSARIENDRVSILATVDSLGIKLSYILKPDTTKTKEIQPIITPKKTRQEIRQENRTERNKDDQNGKTAREKEDTKQIEAKQSGKTDRTKTRKENKGSGFDWFWVGLFVGLAAMYLFFTKILRR